MPTLGCLSAMAAVAQIAFIVAHFANLWSRPEYQFLPIVPIMAWMLYRPKTDSISASSRATAAVALALVAAALGILAAVLVSPWMAYASALGFAATAATCVDGMAGLRRATPTLVMLATLLPLPFGATQWVTQTMQKLTMNRVSVLLDVHEILHYPRGLTVEIPGHRLFVEEACSGIHGLFAVLVWALFVGLYRRRSLPRIAALLAAGAFWSALANLLRVYGICSLLAQNGVDLSTGPLHEWFGLATFAIAAALLASTDYLLEFATMSRGMEAPPVEFIDDDAALQAEPPSRASRAAIGVCASSCIALGLAELIAFGPAAVVAIITTIVGDRTVGDPLAAVTEQTFQPSGDHWNVRKQFADERPMTVDFGERSKTWVLESADRVQLVLSVDYPFHFEHDLTQCYTNDSWRVESKTLRGTGKPSATLAQAPVVEAKMARLGKFAELRFRFFETGVGPCALKSFDAAAENETTGELLHRRVVSSKDSWQTALSHFPNYRFAGKRRLFQIQAFASSYRTLTDADRKAIDAAFDQFCEQLEPLLQTSK